MGSTIPETDVPGCADLSRPVYATAVTTSDRLVGAVLQDRYHVQARLAAGGMGVVYRGERTQLGKPVAIKFLHASVMGDAQAVARFDREARAMSRLSHPSCVSVIDFGVHEGTPYLVMDFASGRTLREVLQGGRLPVPQAVQICRQLLAGLSHAHGHDIVHRDIKPENVVVDDAEGFGSQIRILDFGVAKLCDLTGSSLTAGFAVGTPSYMSPEQTGGEPVDARSDVYGVGVLLFEMLTGRKPFVADQALDVLRMHREAARPRLGAVAADQWFSPEMEALVARALARSPSERFQSAREMAQALDATPEAASRAAVSALLRSNRPATTRPASGLLPSGAFRPRRGGVGLILALLAIFVVAGVVAALTLFDWDDGAPQAEPGPGGGAAEPESLEIELPPESATPTDEQIPGIEQVHGHIAAGRWRSAVDALVALRRQHPDSAYLPYLLGTLYLEKIWAEDGLAAYRDALRLDPEYKNDPVLIRSAMRTFVSDNNAPRGIAFLRDQIGAPAVPFLTEAARSKNPKVAKRAESALAQIQKGQ